MTDRDQTQAHRRRREPAGADDPRRVRLAALLARRRRALVSSQQLPPDVLRRTAVVGVVLLILLGCVFALVLGRVVQLQTHPSEQLADAMHRNQATRSLIARRGNLVDRQGRVLAVTRPAHRAFVDPVLIEDLGRFVLDAGRMLGLKPVEIAKAISARPRSRYIVLVDRMTDAQLARTQAGDLDGLAVESYLVRDYPNGKHAGHLIGFVGDEGRGLEGLELAMDPQLAGDPGKVHLIRDAWRHALWARAQGYQPVTDGAPVRTSIDLTIQCFTEDALSQACEKFEAAAGNAVVIKPDTGEILAMANWPAFNPEKFAQASPEQWRNRCVTDVYEPGSIFKPFVWAAATEAGYADPHEMIDCTTSGFYVSQQGRRLRDVRGHGRVDWSHVLIESSNIGMAIVGQRMGKRALHDAVTRFGFNEFSGSALPGEAIAGIRPVAKWTHYSVTSIPMGQEIAVNTLQLVRAFCALANDGLLVTPMIHAIDPTDPVRAAPIVERVLSPQTARLTRHVLHEVVTEGTGKRARSKLYDIFGKTGTAQIHDPEDGGYLQDQYVSSFVAGAPLEAPQIVVLVSIHQPDKQKGYFGGTVAGPAVKSIIEQSLLYLGVPPATNDHDHEMLVQQR